MNLKTGYTYFFFLEAFLPCPVKMSEKKILAPSSKLRASPGHQLPGCPIVHPQPVERTELYNFTIISICSNRSRSGWGRRVTAQLRFSRVNSPGCSQTHGPRQGRSEGGLGRAGQQAENTVRYDGGVTNWGHTWYLGQPQYRIISTEGGDNLAEYSILRTAENY